MSHYAPGSVGLLAPLQPWLEDVQVSEILINRPQEVWIEKQGTLKKETVTALTHAHLLRLCQLIANENKQRVSSKEPLLSGSLQDGSRVQIVLPPTATAPTLSIRRKVVRHLTLKDYQKDTHFFSQARGVSLQSENRLENLPKTEQALVALYRAKKWHDFIALAVQLKKNIVISGGTSSGKTTFLNACLQEIDHDARICILEDTREVDAPHPNQVCLLASKGDQGEANVSMQDLVQCCLRLRPDRIIVGEIRGKEILDFLSASATGHEGSLTSIHANNPQIAFMRMTQMYKLNNVPSMTDQDILNELKTVIDIIIQIEKHAQGRRIHSIYYRYGDV